MLKRLLVSAIVLIAGFTLSPILRAQGGAAAQSADEANAEKWNTPAPDRSYFQQKAGPAPRRDLSGVWDGNGGVGAKGVLEYPDDPKHVGTDVPYTAEGKAARAKNKPGEGEQQYSAAEQNDPVDFCDPQGFPRMELYELRAAEIFQTKNQVVYLDQFYDQWRVIWTDGRELPKNPEPRWNGYSVGKWVDDYTFVAETVGMDGRTWLDNVGRPHSEELKVEERFHRVDSNTLELTVTIDDPKYYTHPWMALNKHKLRRLPDDYDMYEFICSVSETQEYNNLIGDPAGANLKGK